MTKKPCIAEKSLSMYFQLIVRVIYAVGKMVIAPERKLDSKRVW